MNVDKIRSQIDILNNDLKIRLDEINQDNRFFSPGELRFVSADIRELVRETLKKVFGDQNNINQKGLWGDQLSYQHRLDAQFAHSVLFGYLSVDGNDPFRVNDARTRPWRERDNLFYKGSRWSTRKLKDQFYSFFNILKEVVGADYVPVRYWVTHAKTPHLMIVPSDGTVKAAKGFLPIYCFKEGSIDDCEDTSDCQLASFFETLRKLNASTSNRSREYDSNVLTYTYAKLHEEYQKAWNHAQQAHSLLLNEWVKDFQIAEVDAGWGELSAEEKCCEVFKVVCLYQYHDTPFVINLFQPAMDENNFKNYFNPRNQHQVVARSSGTDENFRAWAWLAITHSVDENIDEQAKQVAAELTNVLGNLYVIEDRITERHKEDVGYQLKFERWYHQVRGEYETLGEIIQTMLSAICRQLNVPTQQITSRVKSCESLFEKICKRANGREPGETEEYRKTYLEIIRHGLYSKLTLCIHDLVGVRIVCVFDDDVARLEIAIQTLLEDTELATVPNHLIQEKGVKQYKSWREIEEEGQVRIAFDYRSTHYTVKLGGLRVNLPEAKGLQNKVCEIQLRSILAHGWADVAHEVYYKPALPQTILAKSDLAKQILRDLSFAAATLEEQDKKFTDARKSYKKMLHESGEHSGD